MAKPTKKVVLGILDKLELEHTAKITMDQAKEKLERAVEDDEGLFDEVDFSDPEINALIAMDFELDIEDEEEEDDFEDEEEDDFEDEEEDDEPVPAKKEPKKKSAKKEPKPKKEKKAKTLDRITSACRVLQKRKNHVMTTFVEESDAFHADNGGNLNPKEAVISCRRVLKVLSEFNSIEITGEKIKVLS